MTVWNVVSLFLIVSSMKSLSKEGFLLGARRRCPIGDSVAFIAPFRRDRHGSRTWVLTGGSLKAHRVSYMVAKMRVFDLAPAHVLPQTIGH